jgi:hypothetical protein
MKKPSPFQLKDTLLFGAVFALAAVGAFFVYTGNFESVSGEPIPTGITGIHGLMATLLLSIVGGYVAIVWYKWRQLKEFTYVTGADYALMVKAGGYNFNREEIIRLADITFGEWAAVIDDVQKYRKGALIWVWFEEGAVDHPLLRNTKLAGYAINNTSSIHVSYTQGIPVEQTAFKHELGHLIIGNVTGNWSQNEHHKMAKEWGLD